MDVKVIFSSGGRYCKNQQQKLADKDTFETAIKIDETLKDLGHRSELVKITPSQVDKVRKFKTDVVFNLCEWSGKDYYLGVKVLKNLESKDIAHTGTDSLGYEWGCDKVAMKKMFDNFEVPTPNWIYVDPEDSKKDITTKISKLQFPLIAKPAYEHCAIGIDGNSILRSKESVITKAMFLKRKFMQPILIEEYIVGREFTLTVVKNHSLHIFPPAEVVFGSKKPNQQFLSFNLEWLGHSYGAKILKNSNPLFKKLQTLAKEVFLKMGCRGYARIDVRVKRGKIYVLELNVNPSILPIDNYGLTASTQADNWDFKKLVKEIAGAARN